MHPGHGLHTRLCPGQFSQFSKLPEFIRFAGTLLGAVSPFLGEPRFRKAIGFAVVGLPVIRIPEPDCRESAVFLEFPLLLESAACLQSAACLELALHLEFAGFSVPAGLLVPEPRVFRTNLFLAQFTGQSRILLPIGVFGQSIVPGSQRLPEVLRSNDVPPGRNIEADRRSESVLEQQLFAFPHQFPSHTRSGFAILSQLPHYLAQRPGLAPHRLIAVESGTVFFHGEVLLPDEFSAGVPPIEQSTFIRSSVLGWPFRRRWPRP